jgi:hypothetical protein
MKLPSLRGVRSALSSPSRVLALRYLLIATAANLVWEAAQLPLYLIWRTATRSELAYALVHCTLGDLVILTAALLIGLLLGADDLWPVRCYSRVALLASALGVSATIVGEWLNVEVWGRWAYAPAMPVLPPFGTGLSPFLQWLLIPPVAFFIARPRRSRP